jgi:hypothetical protein
VALSERLELFCPYKWEYDRLNPAGGAKTPLQAGENRLAAVFLFSFFGSAILR